MNSIFARLSFRLRRKWAIVSGCLRYCYDYWSYWSYWSIDSLFTISLCLCGCPDVYPPDQYDQYDQKPRPACNGP